MADNKMKPVRPPSDLIKFIVGSVVMILLSFVVSFTFLATTNSDGAAPMGEVLKNSAVPSLTGILGLAGGAGIQRARDDKG